MQKSPPSLHLLAVSFHSLHIQKIFCGCISPQQFAAIGVVNFPTSHIPPPPVFPLRSLIALAGAVFHRSQTAAGAPRGRPSTIRCRRTEAKCTHWATGELVTFAISRAMYANYPLRDHTELLCVRKHTAGNATLTRLMRRSAAKYGIHDVYYIAMCIPSFPGHESGIRKAVKEQWCGIETNPLRGSAAVINLMA